MKVSLFRKGVNLEEVDPQMSKSFMAGVFNRMRDITLFLNPQVESYERFGENEAPKYITWSAQNRSRLMRVPWCMARRRALFCVPRIPGSIPMWRLAWWFVPGWKV